MKRMFAGMSEPGHLLSIRIVESGLEILFDALVLASSQEVIDDSVKLVIFDEEV